MAGKKIAVFGIYQNKKQAERTVDKLLAAEFSNDDISVLLPDNQGTKDFAHDKSTKAPEGTAAGVTTGGVIGGTLGLLAGIGVLAIPGIGPFIAAGPIVTALAGLGAGGAVGGIIGALVGMGIPEYEAKAIRRTHQSGRSFAFGSLRHIREDRAGERSAKAYGRPGYRIVYRSWRGHPRGCRRGAPVKTTARRTLERH